jgi:hypothetical protein
MHLRSARFSDTGITTGTLRGSNDAGKNEPRHCSCPEQMIPTLEHKLSASSIECVVRIMLLSRVADLQQASAHDAPHEQQHLCLMKSHRKRLVETSRPLEGSSRNSAFGRPVCVLCSCVYIYECV